MKCNAKLFYRLDKQGNPTKKVFGWLPRDSEYFDNPEYMVIYWKMNTKTKFSEEFVVCDGDIKFSHKLTSEPYFGGVDMGLILSCTCNKCGRSIYSVVTEDNLDDIVNMYLTGLE